MLTQNWLHHDLAPNVSITFKDAPLQTNRWAMRDKDYTKAKPPGTFRMGILGGSYVMGSGVGNEEVFEAICEENLNQEQFLGMNYELLNFSVPGYHLMHFAHLFDNRAVQFDPDAILVFTHGVDFGKVLKMTRKGLRHDETIGLPFLRPVMEKWGFVPGNTPQLVNHEQNKFSREVIRSCYHYLGRECRKHEILPILVYWPLTKTKANPEELVEIFDIAREAGFSIIDLGGVYDEFTSEELMIDPADQHPNTLGHQLIADRLLENIQTSSVIRSAIISSPDR